jgi:hypothetical protein
MLNFVSEYPRMLGAFYQWIARWRWLEFHDDIETHDAEQTNAQEAQYAAYHRAATSARVDANTDMLLALARIERLQWTK